MNRPVHIDGILRQWDELYSAKGADQGKRDPEQFRPLRGGRREGSADSARAALRGIAGKCPQAVVKITGGGKGAAAISAHLRYISRNGQLPLEDQDERAHVGQAGRVDVLERWEHTGLPAESKYKEAFNIVLSSPKGADGASVLNAAREFAKEQFAEHDYVMALHSPQTDPSSKKSENAHVHLVVRARSRDGKRLNPRKADLFAYGQAYARHLRANGITVIAVRREAVFNTKNRGEAQSVYQMKKRGVLGPKVTQDEALRKALVSEARARELYVDVVAALAKSMIEDDRILSRGLREVLPSIGTARTVTPHRRRR